MEMPTDWVTQANWAQSVAELEELRCSVNRGRPYGSEDWHMRMTKKLGLEFSLHRRGRPRKDPGWQQKRFASPFSPPRSGLPIG